MKIRQALKLYNKSKHTLLKIRTIEDDGTVLGRNTRSFKQWKMCTGQRDRIIDENGKRLKRSKYYIYYNNISAKKRILKYLKKNKNIAFFVDSNKLNFEAVLKTNIELFKKYPIPEIGKEYYCYDDGKISLSRESKVKILNIIPYKEASKNIIELWKQDYHEFYFSTANITDYFIEAIGEDNKISYFARTVYGAWFSIGDIWDKGYLDAENKFHKTLTDE